MLSSGAESENGLFGDLRRLEREMSGLFETWPWPVSIRQGRGRGYPPSNVGVTTREVDIYLFAPGCRADGFDISMQQNVLTIAGERPAQVEQEGQCHQRERYSGAFRRVFTLPEDVDPERVEAHYRDGVLRLRIERRAAVQPRKIEVK